MEGCIAFPPLYFLSYGSLCGTSRVVFAGTRKGISSKNIRKGLQPSVLLLSLSQPSFFSQPTLMFKLLFFYSEENLFNVEKDIKQKNRCNWGEEFSFKNKRSHNLNTPTSSFFPQSPVFCKWQR